LTKKFKAVRSAWHKSIFYRFSGSKTPDYILPENEIVLEIGGKGKARSLKIPKKQLFNIHAIILR
jgi:hypothetical protein